MYSHRQAVKILIANNTLSLVPLPFTIIIFQLEKNFKIIMEGVTDESPYFSHQSFTLLFSCLGESIMICFYDDQLRGRRVKDKLAWSVPQWSGYLVEYHAQFL